MEEIPSSIMEVDGIEFQVELLTDKLKDLSVSEPEGSEEEMDVDD